MVPFCFTVAKVKFLFCSSKFFAPFFLLSFTGVIKGTSRTAIVFTKQIALDRFVSADRYVDDCDSQN